MIKKIHINGVGLNAKQIIKNNQRPTILFLHDSWGCVELWRDFPERLSDATNCNVVVYDRRGYGKSDPFATIRRENDYLEKEADTLNVLIKELSIKNIILFGHSDGASISLIALAKYPQHFIGGIVEGAHIFVEDITVEGVKTAVEAYENSNLKEKLQKYHGEKTEAVFAAWTGIWLGENFKKTWNIEHFLPQIHCPVLVIQGENDEYGTMAQVNGIVRKVSGDVRKIVLPKVGHTPHKEASDAALECATLFIKKITGRK